DTRRTDAVISPSSVVTSPILCVVSSSVNLLADPITDEVFAHLTLHPFPPPTSRFDEEDGHVREGPQQEANRLRLTRKSIHERCEESSDLLSDGGVV
ncbi:unnamed protein product, partial [Brassica oleracea]